VIEYHIKVTRLNDFFRIFITENLTLMVRQKNSPSSLPLDITTLQHGLTLYNDDINTFEFVIETLIEVCNHQPEQAEQCAIITHFRGKCNVKSGDYKELKPLSDEMSSRGLTVSID